MFKVRLALSSLKLYSTMQFMCILQMMELKIVRVIAEPGNFKTGILAIWQHII